ncbi:unnamed protein product [Linum trigynum]|uniref:Uncharacterized protein n=1 Tax=Linum trigynum TaxID=586398 RepID=A0AAV2EBV5_9ROSI
MVESSVEARKMKIRVQEEQPAVVFKHRESDEQRDNLFHSRCFVEGKLISFVINGGCCSNIISLYAVQKLGLTTQRHPAPYQLSWINEHGTINVTNQAVVRFQLGSYEDEVICDVVSMNYVHLILGRPWQFDRGVTHNGWENSYTFRYKGRKIKLKPLSPDDVYTDQKQIEENQNEGKEPRAQLWIKRCIGFNFLSFRKLQREFPTPETTASNDLCFSDVKQSSAFRSPADVVEAKPVHDVAKNVCLDIGGTTKSLEKSPELVGDDQAPPSTTLPPHCYFTEKQSVKNDDLVMATGDDSSAAIEFETFQEIPRTNSRGEELSNSAEKKNSIQAKIPLETAVQSRREGDLGGEVGSRSDPTSGAETIYGGPGSFSLEWNPSNASESKEPILAKSALQKLGNGKETTEVGGAIDDDSDQMEVSDTFWKDPGSCRELQFVSKQLGIKTPKIDLVFLCCGYSNSGDGGKRKLIDSTRMVMNQGWKRDLNFNRRPGEDVGVDELDWECFNSKTPICSKEFVCKEELRRRANYFDPFQVQLIGDKGFFQAQEEFTTALQASKVLEELEGRFESVNFLPQKMFEQPTFDPIWDQFCERFEQRNAKVLRATLFQEGGPDMIPNCPQFTSQLLDKEAIKVGKKKGRIWLSVGTVSRYILWRHGSRNWLDGNSVLRIRFADKVSIYPMVCLMDSNDVIKVVFQGLKVATSKLENCQKMTKAENCSVRPTLELNSRRMDGIQVKRLPQNETRYVCEQREGIG